MLFALRVPPGNDRGPLYMEQALAAIHQANPRRLPLTLSFLRIENAVILACRVPDDLAAVVQSQLYAAYPDARIETVDEPAIAPRRHDTSWQLPLSLFPDIFPIKRFSQFDDPLARVTADPLTALLSSLHGDTDNRLRARIDLCVRPASAQRHQRAETCLRRLASPFFIRHHRLARLYLRLALARAMPARLGAFLLGQLAGTPVPVPTGTESASSARTHERESVLQAAADKLNRLLFLATLQVAVTGPRTLTKEADAALKQMAGAFGLFHAPGLAAFRGQRSGRLFRRRPAFLLSAEELATLWHPPTATVRSPALAAVDSRQLPPPATLPTRIRRTEATLGTVAFRSQREPFGILDDDRRRHLCIVGKTGMGKSTLLSNLVISDIRAGKGVALIDPHGDLADSILASVPRRRTQDIVLFDAGDSAHPPAFNPLSCHDPAQRPLVASGVVGAFKKQWGDSWGPRLEHILRNALLAILEKPDTTLVSLVRLLGDNPYRKEITGRLQDPIVRSFWQREFALWPAKLQAEALAPVQNKVGHLISSPLLRNIVGQARSRLDLRRIMDEGNVLIVNLSKGRVGDDASALLGSLLVSALQLAAMSRADIPEEQRRDFHLYVDEFQNFATDSFATILSEARKYRLSLTLAHQYLAQVEEQTLAAVFGNVGSLLAFQVGAQDAEIVAAQLGEPLLPADLLRLPRYQAYVRLLIDGQPSRPFSMQTLPPDLHRPDLLRAQAIRRYCRQRYARPAAIVAAEIGRAFSGLT